VQFDATTRDRGGGRISSTANGCVYGSYLRAIGLTASNNATPMSLSPLLHNDACARRLRGARSPGAGDHWVRLTPCKLQARIRNSCETRRHGRLDHRSDRPCFQHEPTKGVRRLCCANRKLIRLAPAHQHFLSSRLIRRSNGLSTLRYLALARAGESIVGFTPRFPSGCCIVWLSHPSSGR
jgi:hypothetical protein